MQLGEFCLGLCLHGNLARWGRVGYTGVTLSLCRMDLIHPWIIRQARSSSPGIWRKMDGPSLVLFARTPMSANAAIMLYQHFGLGLIQGS